MYKHTLYGFSRCISIPRMVISKSLECVSLFFIITVILINPSVYAALMHIVEISVCWIEITKKKNRTSFNFISIDEHISIDVF